MHTHPWQRVQQYLRTNVISVTVAVAIALLTAVYPTELLALSSTTVQTVRDSATRNDVQVIGQAFEGEELQQLLQETWTKLRSQTFGLIAQLPLILVGLSIVGIASVLAWLLSRWGGPSFLTSRNPFLQNLIRRFLQIVIVLLGCVLALDVLNATALVGAVVGTAGLAGLAIGFAFKDIVENYLAGTILALRQPFAKNDIIRVESFEGKVVRLTPRETILMTAEGNHVRLPNSLIFRSPMINFTRNPLRRFEFDAGIGTEDDPALARTVALNTLRDMKGILIDPPPEVLVTELAASSVNMRFFAWVDQRETDFLRARSEAIRLVKHAIEKAGISLPSPGYVVQMQADDDAPVQRAPVAPPAAVQNDVSVDRSLDEQIASERYKSDEPDLLDTKRTGPTSSDSDRAAQTANPQPPL